jgi:Tfp pilus assembly protein PilV
VTFRLRSDESGFSIIEVLVSALLVAILSVGILAQFDSASATSNLERTKAEASALAQKDVERLRAMSPVRLKDLAAGPSSAYQEPDVTVRGTTYTTTTTITRVDEPGAAGTCVGSAPTASYLRINSSVSWTGKPSGISPSRHHSIIGLPSNGGSVVVKINDRNGNGLGSTPVNLSGGNPQRTTVLPEGCVQWDGLAPGSYTVSFSRPGYVTPDGVNAYSKDITVSEGATNYVTVTYDVGGSRTVPFYYKVGSNPVVPAPSGVGMDRVSVSHTGLAAPRTFGTSGTYVHQLSLGPLFPFTTGYRVYPGACTGMDPVHFGYPAVTLSWTNPSGPFTLSDTSGVRLASFTARFNYKWGPGNPRNEEAVGARIYLYRAADANGCAKLRHGPLVATQDVGSKLAAIPWAAAPLGTYTLCADYTDTHDNIGTWRTWSSLNGVNLTNWTAQPNLGTFEINSQNPNGVTTGACPAGI